MGTDARESRAGPTKLRQLASTTALGAAARNGGWWVHAKGGEARKRELKLFGAQKCFWIEGMCNRDGIGIWGLNGAQSQPILGYFLGFGFEGIGPKGGKSSLSSSDHEEMEREWSPRFMSLLFDKRK